MSVTAEKQNRVLIVDDDDAFLQVAGAILRRRQLEVTTAASAGEALSLVEAGFYHIVILDISLPDMTGTELLPRLLEARPDTMAIMLTGHSSAENAIQSLNGGAFAFLEKPLDPEYLLSVINQGLEKQGLLFENHNLVAELEQRNRETGILLRVSQAVLQSLELPQILAAALEHVVHSLDVDAGHIHLLKNDRLVLHGQRGFAAGLVSTIAEMDGGGGILGTLLRLGRPVVIKNLSAASEPDLAPLVKHGYKFYCGVPLVVTGENIGVMGVAASRGVDFTHKQVELFSAIGREISIAVQNTRLYEEASSARALKELEALRGELLANVSHELRTPLAAIKGCASTVCDPEVNFDESTLRDFLETIDKEADRLNQLIEEMLIMSRLEAGALEVDTRPLAAAEIIAAIRDRLDNLTAGYNFSVNVNGGRRRVAADTARLGQVLTNLVENAVKYGGGKGSSITLEARGDGDAIVFSVSDEGSGIPAELHDKIFERFYQVADPQLGHRPGAGLGLCICRGIVSAHRGRIWVESEAGRGSKFSFSLPVIKE